MLAMAASSRLLHWEAGSEVGVEVKLSLIKKRSKHNMRTAAFERQSAFSFKAHHLHDIATLLFFHS